MPPPGLHTVPDRHGQPMQVLVWHSGTNSEAEGRDLAAIARTLTFAHLEYWERVLRNSACFHEAGILQQEIDSRDPREAVGTLWQFWTPPELEHNWKEPN